MEEKNPMDKSRRHYSPQLKVANLRGASDRAGTSVGSLRNGSDPSDAKLTVDVSRRISRRIAS